jgi:hypothetical protein
LLSECLRSATHRQRVELLLHGSNTCTRQFLSTLKVTLEGGEIDTNSKRDATNFDAAPTTFTHRHGSVPQS